MAEVEAGPHLSGKSVESLSKPERCYLHLSLETDFVCINPVLSKLGFGKQVQMSEFAHLDLVSNDAGCIQCAELFNSILADVL